MAKATISSCSYNIETGEYHFEEHEFDYPEFPKDEIWIVSPRYLPPKEDNIEWQN